MYKLIHELTSTQIFGSTGMKLAAQGDQWANYPESNAWMAGVHVFDHFDYTHDVAWWQQQGWPLLKGVAQFHLTKLIPDGHFNDTTLVVAPCNSPEQAPITFGMLKVSHTGGAWLTSTPHRLRA